MASLRHSPPNLKVLVVLDPLYWRRRWFLRIVNIGVDRAMLERPPVVAVEAVMRGNPVAGPLR